MARRVRSFLDLIKFEHTVFALPFAYLGMVLAAGGWPGWWTFIWVSVAMAAARTAGMSLNRLIDRHVDARNPRTANRPLQTGRITVRTTAIGAALSVVILAVAAALLNPVTLLLFPGALFFLAAASPLLPIVCVVPQRALQLRKPALATRFLVAVSWHRLMATNMAAEALGAFSAVLPRCENRSGSTRPVSPTYARDRTADQTGACCRSASPTSFPVPVPRQRRRGAPPHATTPYAVTLGA